MKYIGYQGDHAAFVANSMEEIEAVRGIEFDRVEKVERAEMVRGVILIGDEIESAVANQALEQAKAERAKAVEALTVEVDGMVFDGNEKAQERMSRAVNMADSMDEQTEWVLADNTVAIVTAAQLRQACRKAGKAQTALWIVPYEA